MTVTLLYFNHKLGQEESMILSSECNIELLELKGIGRKDLKHVPVKTVDQLIACREEFLRNKSVSNKIINFINSIQKKFTISEKKLSIKITDPNLSNEVIGQIMSPFLEKNETVMDSASKKVSRRSFTPKKHRSYSIKALH